MKTVETDKKTRMFRGNDTWILTVYSGEMPDDTASIGAPYELSVFDYIYRNKILRIGSDNEKCQIALAGLEPVHLSVSFEQDLGLCYSLGDNTLSQSITDGMILKIANDSYRYCLTFSLEEKDYLGFLFESAEPDHLSDSSETEDMSVEEIIQEGKQAFRKGTRNFIVRFKDWVKRNF